MLRPLHPRVTFLSGKVTKAICSSRTLHPAILGKIFVARITRSGPSARLPLHDTRKQDFSSDSRRSRCRGKVKTKLRLRDQNELASCPDPKGGVSIMNPERVLWARKYLMNCFSGSKCLRGSLTAASIESSVRSRPSAHIRKTTNVLGKRPTRSGGPSERSERFWSKC